MGSKVTCHFIEVEVNLPIAEQCISYLINVNNRGGVQEFGQQNQALSAQYSNIELSNVILVRFPCDFLYFFEESLEGQTMDCGLNAQ